MKITDLWTHIDEALIDTGEVSVGGGLHHVVVSIAHLQHII